MACTHPRCECMHHPKDCVFLEKNQKPLPTNFQKKLEEWTTERCAALGGTCNCETLQGNLLCPYNTH